MFEIFSREKAFGTFLVCMLGLVTAIIEQVESTFLISNHFKLSLKRQKISFDK